MLVRDIMTPEVEVVRPDATLMEAARRMRDLDVGLLPVGDGRQVLGMLTDRDIAIRAVAEGRDPRTTPVREVMTEETISCYDDQDVTEAARLLEQKQLRRLLVLDRSKQLVGVVSLGDLALKGGKQKLSGGVLEAVSEPAHPKQ